MKARGLIFTASSVRSLLSGAKTQTRRLVRPGYEPDPKRSPYGAIGDFIYAKETWSFRSCLQHEGALPDEPCTCRPVLFAADHPEATVGARPGGWVSPMYMAKRDARVWLELTDLRIQRLHDLTEDDARAEGVDCIKAKVPSARDAYMLTWDAIHVRDAKWALWGENPMVWALSFKQTSSP